MNKTLLLPAIFAFTFAAAQQPAVPPAQRTYNEQLGFVENKGQLADRKGNLLSDVLFKATGTDAGMYVTTTGITYVFHSDAAPACMTEEATRITRSWSKIEMRICGATVRPENIIREDALPGVSNYYYPHCPQGILGVQSWRTITIKEIYPGIDWVLTADPEKGMAHDFIVHPGADANQVKLMYVGGPLTESSDEHLVFTTAHGTLREGKLLVYEQETGKVIPANFEVMVDFPSCVDRHRKFVNRTWVEYEIPALSTKRTLIIDPPLQWTMPQSSTDVEYGYGVSSAKDGSGDVLLTGSTAGTDFPDTLAYQGTLYGFEDMVVVRLDAQGVREWATYYGGTDYEQGKGVASDVSGNCYVAGNTGSNDFPVLNPLQANYGNGVYDLAVIKFDAGGVRQWATWYGSFGNEYGTGIAVDAGTGDVYVTGYTNSQFFITTAGAIQATKNTGYDGYILKVNTSCVMQWCTFYGGDDDDKIRAITIDPNGSNIYLSGSTLSGTFPVTAGVFQSASASPYFAEEAFITKISAAQVVQFSSFCGGTDADFGQGIAVDNNGNIFITGYTLSGDFPVANPGGTAYVDSTIGSIGTHDAFIVGCNSTGTTRFWSTYFGGTMTDMAFSIASDNFVGVYICGNTASTDFPVQMPVDNVFYQSTHGDGGTYNDMFIAWFDQSSAIKWSTYYGGLNSDEAYGIAVDAGNNIFLTGVDNNDMAALKFNPGFPTGAATDGPYYRDQVIYPNPARDELILHFASYDEGAFTFEMLNMNGQLVSKSMTSVTAGHRNTYRFDISTLPEGIYFLLTYCPDGTLHVKKFVKQ